MQTSKVRNWTFLLIFCTLSVLCAFLSLSTYEYYFNEICSFATPSIDGIVSTTQVIQTYNLNQIQKLSQIRYEDAYMDGRFAPNGVFVLYLEKYTSAPYQSNGLGCAGLFAWNFNDSTNLIKLQVNPPGFRGSMWYSRVSPFQNIAVSSYGNIWDLNTYQEIGNFGLSSDSYPLRGIGFDEQGQLYTNTRSEGPLVWQFDVEGTLQSHLISERVVTRYINQANNAGRFLSHPNSNIDVTADETSVIFRSDNGDVLLTLDLDKIRQISTITFNPEGTLFVITGATSSFRYGDCAWNDSCIDTAIEVWGVPAS